MAGVVYARMTKLTSLNNRIAYINNETGKQEHMLASYSTMARKDWIELGKYNQKQFKKSNIPEQKVFNKKTKEYEYKKSSCIEGRELIFHIPHEVVKKYDNQSIIEFVSNQFKEKYNVDVTAALHLNKNETNYHIHLIFSERIKLKETKDNDIEIKLATRDTYYDEKGKRSTKKNCVDENGNLKDFCRIIKKGEPIKTSENIQNLNDNFNFVWSEKQNLFKEKQFLNEYKQNICELFELQMFDNNKYFGMKKIGIINPITGINKYQEEIIEYNENIKKINQCIDQGLITKKGIRFESKENKVPLIITIKKYINKFIDKIIKKKKSLDELIDDSKKEKNNDNILDRYEDEIER